MEQTKKEVSTKDTSERSNNVSVYNFDEVEIPKAIEKNHEAYVIYGLNNDFPQQIIDAWLLSGIHNALTTGIVQMIGGDGLTFEPATPEVELFAKRVNRQGDTMQDLINKTAFDLYLHGYFGWQIVWNQARTKIVGIYHTPAEQIRAGKADEEGVVNDYYVSWDWEQYRKEKFAPQRIKAYDPADRSEGKQMMFVKMYRPNQFYYSTPAYFGGMNWILMDNRVSEYHLNNIENGFFPSSIVQFFNGEPPAEKKRALERKFMQKFTGKRQAKIVFVYNDNREEEVTFSTHEPANVDKRFRDLMPEIAKNILIAHRVPSPLLFGIRESTGLGNNAEELESSSLLMNKMVIIPLQNVILDTLTEVFKINNWKVDITIETLQPLQFLDGDSDDADASTDEDTTDGVKTVAKPGESEPPVVEEIQKQALNGAQISSLLQILQDYSAGVLTKDSAKAVLEAAFPTFTPEMIANLLADPAEVAKAFSKEDTRKVLPDNMVKPVLKHLDSKGTTIEDMEKAGYTLVMDDEQMTSEGIKSKLRPDMFSVDTSEIDPGEMPEDGFYLVRYQYRAGQGRIPIVEGTRDFCRHMIEVNSNKVYSADEIQAMDNPEFGNYDIFEFKGSYNCRHKWSRLVWFRTVSTRGKVPGYKMSPTDEVPVRFLPPGDAEATKVNDKVKT